MSTGRSRLWFWIIIQRGEAEILDGPFDTREEANATGYKTGNYFEVFEWPTVDRSRAVQIYRETKLQRTGDLDRSLERVRHKI